MPDYSDVQGLTGEQLNERSRQDPNFNPRDALWEQQKGMFEDRLRDRARGRGAENYDMAELQDIERWVKNAANAGRDASPALEGAFSKIDQRFNGEHERLPGPGGGTGGGNPGGGGDNRGTPTGGNTTYTSPTAPTTPPPQQAVSDEYLRASMAAMQRQADLTEQMFKRQQEQEAANAARRDSLYSTLLDRSKQSLQIDRNDPIIHNQAAAFNANTARSSRDYLSDIAEQEGPYRNMAGEQRMMAEKGGIANASFEAELLGRELSTRRAEIVDALNSMRGLLTTDQQNALQSQLALLDQAIKEQQVAQGQFGLDTQRMVGMGGVNNNLLSTLLQNEQFNNRLGFDYGDRQAYWDMARKNPDAWRG